MRTGQRGFKSIVGTVLVIGILIYLIPLFIENMLTTSHTAGQQKGSQVDSVLVTGGAGKGPEAVMINVGRSQISDQAELSAHKPSQESVMVISNKAGTGSLSVSSATGAGVGNSSEQASSAVVRTEDVLEDDAGVHVPVITTLNPVMSDEAVLEGIRAHQSQQEQIQDVLSEREKKIEVIHQAIVSSGGGDNSASGDTAGSEPQPFTESPQENETPRDFVVRAGGPSL